MSLPAGFDESRVSGPTPKRPQDFQTLDRFLSKCEVVEIHAGQRIYTIIDGDIIALMSHNLQQLWDMVVLASVTIRKLNCQFSGRLHVGFGGDPTGTNPEGSATNTACRGRHPSCLIEPITVRC